MPKCLKFWCLVKMLITIEHNNRRSCLLWSFGPPPKLGCRGLLLLKRVSIKGTCHNGSQSRASGIIHPDLETNISGIYMFTSQEAAYWTMELNEMGWNVYLWKKKNIYKILENDQKLFCCLKNNVVRNILAYIHVVYLYTLDHLCTK